MKRISAKTIDFEGWAKEVRTAYGQAQSAERTAKSRKYKVSLRPENTPNGVLYLLCYRYYRALKRDKKLQRLAKHLASDASGRWLKHKGQGTANVLRLLEKPDSAWLLTPTRRARIADELDFADRWDIRSEVLLAFLYEAGAHRDIVKAARAPKPADWIRRYQRISNLIRKASERRRQTRSAASSAIDERTGHGTAKS
jgi:hypothetical protein